MCDGVTMKLQNEKMWIFTKIYDENRRCVVIVILLTVSVSVMLFSNFPVSNFPFTHSIVLVIG